MAGIGWLASFAGSGAQALDRYATMRQMDQDNQWKRKQQQMELETHASQMEAQRLQHQQLDAAILKQQQDAFESTLSPGQVLDSGSVSRLGDLQASNLVQHRANQFPTLSLAPSGGMQNIGGVTVPGYNQTATPSITQADIYSGTPEQQLQDTTLKTNQFKLNESIDQSKADDLFRSWSTQHPAATMQDTMQAAMQFGASPQAISPAKDWLDFQAKQAAFGNQTVSQTYYDQDPTSPTYRQMVQRWVPKNQVTSMPPIAKGPTWSPQVLQGMADAYTKSGGGVAPAARYANSPFGQQFYEAVYGAPSGNGKEQPKPAVTGADIVGNRAAFNADSASLKTQQSNIDTVKGFERGALANIEMAVGRLSKIIDTGSPFFNGPLRAIDAKLLGNVDVPAFEAARSVALREIAQVTGSMKGVLHQETLNKVDSYMANDQSLAGAINVLNILKQDMLNVTGGRQAQIDETKQRIGGGGNQTPNAPPIGSQVGNLVPVQDAKSKQWSVTVGGKDRFFATKALADQFVLEVIKAGGGL